MRKCNYVPDPGKDYDPDSYTECTVFAGTVVRQVRLLSYTRTYMHAHPDCLRVMHACIPSLTGGRGVMCMHTLNVWGLGMHACMHACVMYMCMRYFNIGSMCLRHATSGGLAVYINDS